MLRKIVSVLAAGVMLLCSAVTVNADTEYRSVDIPVPANLLVLGDSIATGFGLEGYSSGRENCSSYANLLKDKFSAELPKDCKFTLTNRAIDGYDSIELLDLLNKGSLDDELKAADCIVISIGGNDLLAALWNALSNAGITSVSPKLDAKSAVKLLASLGKLKDDLDANLETFDSNIGKIAAYIRSRNKCPVFLQTLYNPLEGFDKFPGIDSIGTDKIARLNEIIKLHAGDPDGGYSVCDVAPLFTGQAKTLTNIEKLDIHPTADGHKLIFETLNKDLRTKSYSYMQAYEIPEETQTAPAAAPAAADTASSVPEKSSEESSSSGVLSTVLLVLGASLLTGTATAAIIKKRGASAK